MNKNFLKSILSLSVLVLLTTFSFDTTFLSGNSFKAQFIAGNFQELTSSASALIQQATFVHPAFAQYQDTFENQLQSFIKKWENFLVFTAKGKILIPSQTYFEVNPTYLNFINEINQDLVSFLEQTQNLKTLILKPEFKFQENYLLNTKLAHTIDQLYQELSHIHKQLDLVQTLLGQERHNNLLILLQNNYEYRATGGFLSALLDIEVYKGKITKIELLDVYEIDGQLIPDLAVPLEFASQNQDLFIRDSNFDPDFHTSGMLIDRQIQKAISKSYDFVASINLSLINEVVPSLIPSKFIYTYLDKSTLNSQIQTDIQIILEKLLNSSDLIIKNFRNHNIQLTAKDPNLDKVLKEKNFYHSLNPSFTTISKVNVNGYKSLFPQDTTLKIIADHSKQKVTKTLQINSKHPYSNSNQIYLESVLKQLGVKNNHDLFAGLKKDIQNYYRLYLPDLEQEISLNQNPDLDYLLLPENLDVANNQSLLEFSYISKQDLFDFKNQIEVINFDQYKKISLEVILPEGKTLFSPFFEFKKIKENTYEIPFDSDFLVIDL